MRTTVSSRLRLPNEQKIVARKAPKASPALLALVAEGFLTRLSFGIVSFALPLYARKLGLDLAEIGFLISLSLIVSMFLTPAMGWVADHIGLKRSYVAALGLNSLTALLLAFALQPWHLYGTRVTSGLSRALRKPSANSLLAEHGGKRTVAQAFAWYATARSTAGALGKALAGGLLTLTVGNYLWVFGVAFLASLVPVLVAAWFIPKSTHHIAKTEPKPQAKGERAAARGRPKIAPAMVFGFLVTGTAAMLRGLLPILAVEHAGLSEAETGLLYLVASVVVLTAGPAFGWLTDHTSRNVVLGIRSLANTLSSVLFLSFPTLTGFMLGTATESAGKAAYRPAWGSLMAEISAQYRQRRARTMAWMGVSEEAGEAMGPILAGLLWNTWGVAALFGTRIALALITEIYALVWLRRRAASTPTDDAPTGSRGETAAPPGPSIAKDGKQTGRTDVPDP